MKQVVLEFHPASEPPKGDHPHLLLCSDAYTFPFEGSYDRLRGYTDCFSSEDGVTHWAYLPRAEDCVNK